MGHPKDNHVAVGVYGQQPPTDECVQLKADWLRKFGAIHSPSSRTALFVYRNQPQQSTNDLAGIATTGGTGVAQGGIRLTD